MGYQSDGICARLLDCVTPLCRIWGLATAVGMYGVGADVIFHRHYLGIYILAVAFLISFLETTWVVSIFLGLCISDDTHPCLRYWDYILWLNRWKKSILYVCLALVMFLEPHAVWLAVISGAMLSFLALLYLVETFKAQYENKDALLGSREDTYDRFEDVPDDIDDSLPEGVNSEDTVANQNEILAV